jgi:quercetin dioxygenase-like cupin family protein
MNRKNVILLALALAPVLAAVPAMATTGSGTSATILARGVAVDKIVTRGDAPLGAIVQKIAIAPGGTTGWHTHPGSAVAIVRSGTLTIYDATNRHCEGRTYRAGQVYVEPGYGHAHVGRNESRTKALELVVTYLGVPLGGGVRIDADAPYACSA